MAAAILKRLDFQKLISRVVIDGDKLETENCTVKNLQRKENGLVYECLESGLPFFPEDAKSATFRRG